MAEMLPVATIVHAMQGRTRLRLPERRGDTALFASIATGLSTLPGIVKVEVQPFTGSVLVYHGASLDQIGTAAERAGLFLLENSGTAEAAADEAKPKLKLPMEPRQAVVSALLAIALWQVMKGHFLPPALTLVWYAARVGGLWGINADGAEDAE